ncbi:MAG: virulence-associated E family protein [Cyanobacteria bacterium P01_F01_bin.3]
MTNKDLLNSGKDNPCPVCGRTKDSDCAWKQNREMVMCHTLAKETPPASLNGYYFTNKYADGVHGKDSRAIYTLTPPKPGEPKPKPEKRFKPEKEKQKSINSAAVQIEVKVSELALMVAEKYETKASAAVILSAWCKEYGHDKYAASRLLNEKLQDVRKTKADFTVNEDHKLVKDDRLLREHFGDRLRFNQLLLQPELDGELFSPAEARVSLITTHDLPIKSGDKDIATLIYRMAQANPYHPIREYLNRVYEHCGNSTDSIEGIAQRYFGTSNPIHQAMLRRWLIAAVARVMNPGCKQDCTLILKGPQGWKKSTFFEVLASKAWFDDSYTHSSDKDERLKLHYSWVIEWGELEVVFEKKSISHVKAFLSCSVDKLRPPYGMSQETLPRSSVIVGSTNEDQFLADTTGNRRYWVVPLFKKININQLRAERDRIWAAAVALYQNGEQWWLTDEESLLADEDRTQYEEVHPWVYSITDYVYNLKEVSTREILCNALCIPVQKHSNPAQKKVSAIFKKLGWYQTPNAVSYKGRRTRVWKRKK